MTWRLARSLEVLRNEVNTLGPNRSKSSDGTLGDAAHAARHSDHNPNGAGVVCAFDITHDPSRGLDMEPLFQHIRANPHPSCTYIIFRRRIAQRSNGWGVQAYNGASPHTEHMHVSASRDYDNTSSWGVATAGPRPQPKEDYMTSDEAKALLVAIRTELGQQGNTLQSKVDALTQRVDALAAALQSHAK